MCERDHSIECDVCGESYGGMNAHPDEGEHECDPASAEQLRLAQLLAWADEPDLHAVRWNGHVVLVNRLANLAACLATGAGLCWAFNAGIQRAKAGLATTLEASTWRPGCQRPAPGWERGA